MTEGPKQGLKEFVTIKIPEGEPDMATLAQMQEQFNTKIDKIFGRALHCYFLAIQAEERGDIAGAIFSLEEAIVYADPKQKTEFKKYLINLYSQLREKVKESPSKRESMTQAADSSAINLGIPEMMSAIETVPGLMEDEYKRISTETIEELVLGVIVPLFNNIGLTDSEFLAELQSLSDYYGLIQHGTYYDHTHSEKCLKIQVIYSFLAKKRLADFLLVNQIEANLSESLSGLSKKTINGNSNLAFKREQNELINSLIDSAHKVAVIAMNTKRPKMALGMLNDAVEAARGYTQQEKYEKIRLVCSRLYARIGVTQKEKREFSKEEAMSVRNDILTIAKIAEAETGNRIFAYLDQFFDSPEACIQANLFNLINTLIAVLSQGGDEVLKALQIDKSEIDSVFEYCFKKAEDLHHEAVVQANNPEDNFFQDAGRQTSAIEEAERDFLETCRQLGDYYLKQKTFASVNTAVDYIKKAREMAEKIGNEMALENISEIHEQIIFTTFELLEEIGQLADENEEQQQKMISCLVKIIEGKDKITAGHLTRTRFLVDQLCMNCGASEQIAHRIGIAAMAHDIGKNSIPKSVLNKAVKLTDGEWIMMKRHPQEGHNMLKEAISDNEESIACIASEIALSHHERWNGEGYPNNTQGKKIPLYGRIMAICDVFDATRDENRPYREGAMPLWRVVKILIEDTGKFFDPEIAQAFLMDIRENNSVVNKHNSNRETTAEEEQVIDFIEQFFMENACTQRNLFTGDETKKDPLFAERKQMFEDLKRRFCIFCRDVLGQDFKN